MGKVFHVKEDDIPVTVDARTELDNVTLEEFELKQPPGYYPQEGERDDTIILSPLQAYRLGLYLVEAVEKGYR